MRRDLHALAEHRSLLLHCEIARRLADDSSLLDRARQKVAHWRDDRRVHPEYAERWSQLLAGPFDELLRTLTAQTEAATALRQTTPFAHVVDAATRNRLWHTARAEWEAALAAP